MCYTAGPRCFTHMDGEYKRAYSALSQSQQEHRDSPDDSTRKQLQGARHDMMVASVNLASTTKGRQQFLKRIQKCEDDGVQPPAGLEAIVEQGELKRKMEMRQAKLVASNPVRPVTSGSKVPPVQGTRLVMSAHAEKQARIKLFHSEEIEKCFSNPEKVYPNGRYPGQYRVTGEGICLVGRVEHGRFEVVTLYMDEVVTKVRSDQLGTEEGREFAARGGVRSTQAVA